jgi:hypothetical protein
MTLPYRKILLFLFILVAILFLMNLWMDKETYPHFALQYREAFDPKVKADGRFPCDPRGSSQISRNRPCQGF